MSDLSFHIHSFVPAAEGEELAHRIALLKARDYGAMLKSKVTSDHAYDLANAGHELAGQFVFADVPAPRLQIAVNCCRALVQAAFCIEHLDTEGAAQ